MIFLSYFGTQLISTSPFPPLSQILTITLLHHIEGYAQRPVCRLHFIIPRSTPEMARTRAAQSRIALSKPKTGTKRKRDEGPEDEVPEPEMPPRRSARFGKPETRDCDICAESKVVYRDFPSLSSCNHDPTVCIECFGKQFVIKVESNQNDGWAACTCPLCNEAVGPNEAQTIVPTTVFREINKMIQKVCWYFA